LWDRFEAGESLRAISRALGRAPSSVRTHVVAAGWRRPVPAADWCRLRLSFREREEISRGLAGASRCGVLPAGWAVRRRQCHARSLPTAAASGIGRRWRIEHRGVGPIGRNRRN